MDSRGRFVAAAGDEALEGHAEADVVVGDEQVAPAFGGGCGGVAAPQGGGLGFGLDFGVVHLGGFLGFADPFAGVCLNDEVRLVKLVSAGRLVVDADVAAAGAEPFQDVLIVFEDDGEDALGVAAVLAGGLQAFAEASEEQAGDLGFVCDGLPEIAAVVVAVDSDQLGVNGEKAGIDLDFIFDSTLFKVLLHLPMNELRDGFAMGLENVLHIGGTGEIRARFEWQQRDEKLRGVPR